MDPPRKIHKLDEVVVNRIAAGEVIQRPANALKELIENSLDAKATNIQIVTKEGGLKLLQIQDNGTGIRKDDMTIVCERFTTSKLQNFEDLRSISTFGFRGEALASISHVALLTITTKTADEKCAYKASYIDSKLKGPPKSCAGNQGTSILIENLFYNVATRRKALSSASEEFAKITDVVVKYAVHNPTVGFVLKKHGEMTPQVRTPHNSTKMNNTRILYGNPVSRELMEIELLDDTYKFKMHALLTNPNFTSKKPIFLFFINNRLVDSSSIRRMLEELYSIYLPKKTHPWCYISLDINPHNVDVNVHPTKHEVKFLHEDLIIERMRCAFDEKLSGNSASRTFYMQARLPNADITKTALQEVLPEYEKDNVVKSKKIQPREMIRTDASDQKLHKFNFTIHTAMRDARNKDIELNKSADDHIQFQKNGLETVALEAEAFSSNNCQRSEGNGESLNTVEHNVAAPELPLIEETITPQPSTSWYNIDNAIPTTSKAGASGTFNIVTSTQTDVATSVHGPIEIESILESIQNDFTEDSADETLGEKCVDEVADKARKRVYQYFGKTDVTEEDQKTTNDVNEKEIQSSNTKEANANKKPTEKVVNANECMPTQSGTVEDGNGNSTEEFKSYSVNRFRREVKLTSVLKLRKEVESNCHEGLKRILSELTFVGCIDETSALVQSGVNLYLCDTRKLTEELFYEIMLYDFANYGVIKFSDAIPLYDLAMMGLGTEEAGWTEADGKKEDLATSVKELLLEKADMLKEYFSIVIDKKGNLKSLPILLDKYFPYEAGLPLYVLRLATEVEWATEQTCFQNVCRETAKYYSEINPVHNTYDWKYITEHVLYPTIKESLLPPKHFAHDSTLLQIASLPELYKVFERC